MRVSFFCFAVVSTFLLLTNGINKSFAWAEEQHISVVGQVFCMELTKDNTVEQRSVDNHSNEANVGAVRILRKKRSSDHRRNINSNSAPNSQEERPFIAPATRTTTQPPRQAQQQQQSQVQSQSGEGGMQSQGQVQSQSQVQIQGQKSEDWRNAGEDWEVQGGDDWEAKRIKRQTEQGVPYASQQAPQPQHNQHIPQVIQQQAPQQEASQPQYNQPESQIPAQQTPQQQTQYTQLSVQQQAPSQQQLPYIQPSPQAQAHPVQYSPASSVQQYQPYVEQPQQQEPESEETAAQEPYVQQQPMYNHPQKQATLQQQPEYSQQILQEQAPQETQYSQQVPQQQAPAQQSPQQQYNQAHAIQSQAPPQKQPAQPQQTPQQQQPQYPQQRSDDENWHFIPSPGSETVHRFRRSALARRSFEPKFTPAKNVLVELYERDTISSDDLLATATTDEDGIFNITGYDTEFNAIRPYLKISHTCPSIFPEYKNCKFITEIDLPYREQQDKDTERTLVVPLTGGSTEVNCE